MLGVNANPYSTHVLVMAAEEMIRKLAVAKGAALTADYRIYVKDEYQTEYLKKVRKAYNWFKHADHDAESIYEGPSPDDLNRVNEMQTLLNIQGHAELGEIGPPIFREYAMYIGLKYPQYLKTDFVDLYPSLKKQYASLSRDPEVLSLVLQRMLMDKGLIPKHTF